eukprot:scaffold114370_cov25-Prasinocladus_malaysianus.AAC.1
MQEALATPLADFLSPTQLDKQLFSSPDVPAGVLALESQLSFGSFQGGCDSPSSAASPDGRGASSQPAAGSPRSAQESAQTGRPLTAHEASRKAVLCAVNVPLHVVCVDIVKSEDNEEKEYDGRAAYP